MMENLKMAYEAIEAGEEADVFEAGLKDLNEWHQLAEQNDTVDNPEQPFNTVALTQQPYIDGEAHSRPFYRASALDKEANEYEVIWDVKDYWEEIEDEQEMCDWDNPESVERI